MPVFLLYDVEDLFSGTLIVRYTKYVKEKKSLSCLLYMITCPASNNIAYHRGSLNISWKTEQQHHSITKSNAGVNKNFQRSLTLNAHYSKQMNIRVRFYMPASPKPYLGIHPYLMNNYMWEILNTMNFSHEPIISTFTSLSRRALFP